MLGVRLASDLKICNFFLPHLSLHHLRALVEISKLEKKKYDVEGAF